MKKILFILPSLKLGGLERVQVTIANALANRGHDVTVMIFNPVFTIQNELSDKVRFIYRPPKKHLGQKIPYIRHVWYDIGLWETRASARTLYDYYVGKEKYDVEIAFFRGRSVKIISGSRNSNAKKLAWVHSDFSKCKGITANFHDLEEVKKAYAVFDKIVCVSKQAEREFQKKIGITETTTIYNPVSVDALRQKAALPCDFNKKRFTVVSVGHLYKVKGYDRLIEACAALHRQGKSLDLVIVGEGEEYEGLKALAERLDFPNLTLTGKLENPYPYMRIADLYVCSSHYEGYNLTVAEALVLGKPVLSTMCAGPCEILDNGKYGMLVENNTQSIRDGIARLLDDPQELESLRRRASERISFFDGAPIISSIEELIMQ